MIATDPFEWLKLSKHIRTDEGRTVLLLIGPSQEEFDQLLAFLKTNFHLSTSDSNEKRMLSLGLNYTFLVSEGEEYLKGLQKPIGIVDIYTITDAHDTSKCEFSKLISVLQTTKNIHLLYFLNADGNGYWCQLSGMLKGKTVDKMNLFTILKKTFEPITDHEWKSVNVIIHNVQKWQYDSINMANVDFIQQIIRSVMIESSNVGSLVYIPGPLEFDSNINHSLNKILPKLIIQSDVEMQSNSTLISKYCDLQIDSKFDSFAKIQMLNKTFDWLNIWKDKWQSDPQEELIVHNVTGRHNVTFKDYYNLKLLELLENGT